MKPTLDKSPESWHHGEAGTENDACNFRESGVGFSLAQIGKRGEHD